MKILFVDMLADLAGHTRTATTIAQALRKRGHQLSFVVPENSRPDVIEAADFKIHRIPAGWAGQYPALERLICSLHEQGEIDVVHSFDKRGVPEAAKAAKKLGIPVFHTICGGIAPQEVLEMKSIISLSHEVKQGLIERTSLGEDDIEVLAARLDFKALLAQVDRDNSVNYSRFREKYNLAPSSKIVLRIARLSADYKDGLLQSADAVAQLYREGHDVCFVHIGFVPLPGEQDFEHVQAHFREINQAAGATLAVTATEEAPHAPDYLGMADIVVGVGRTAFEGMLFAKPTVIVGKAGFAGLVGYEDIEQLAFYNFSGRHRTRAPYAMSVAELTDTLRKLLENRELYERVGEFGRTYVLENLDANAAAGRYEARYHTFSPSDYPTDEQLAKHLNLTPKRVIRGLIPKKLYRILKRF